jgi:hypothetical protein
MKFNEIRKMAKGLNIKTYHMKKIDVIRAIQRAEDNPECYGTQRVEHCREDFCLWRHDCVSQNNMFD